MKYLTLAAIVVGLGACASSNATTESGGVLNGRAMADKTITTNGDGEEIICKKEKATGSRVRVNEVCGTAAQWDQSRDANRQGINHMTSERTASNSN